MKNERKWSADGLTAHDRTEIRDVLMMLFTRSFGSFSRQIIFPSEGLDVSHVINQFFDLIKSLIAKFLLFYYALLIIRYY